MLKTRLLTAIILLLLLGGVLFLLPNVVAEGVIFLLMLVAAWEWSGFLGVQSVRTRYTYTGLLAVVLVAYVLWFGGYETTLLVSALVWWTTAFLWIFVFPTAIPIWLRWLCGALVILPLFAALLHLYRIDPQLLLVALIVVWAADIGAYFAGRQFGRVKLAPSISPGKTWEGVIGGLLAVSLLAVGWALFKGYAVIVVLPFFLAIGAISIVGDLTVSMFKRTAGVKDSGSLFPGHGGVLDRID
ncbi:MAG: phosphatidate cytidylyltransferase, partial [Proteobacteria bacterium]|nr:phosphatidate cytidylyltransferase [Pseudomonadota bacterium]